MLAWSGVTLSVRGPVNDMPTWKPDLHKKVEVDSQGNIYTTETYEGKRLQKFAYKGLRAVSKKEQGTVWPR